MITQRTSQHIRRLAIPAVHLQDSANACVPPLVGIVGADTPSPVVERRVLAIAAETGTETISIPIRVVGGFTVVEIVTVVAIIAILAIIAIPSYVRARGNSERNNCLYNLRVLDDAKQQWALENNKVNGAAPSNTEVSSYLRNRVMPTCPSGGTYELGNVGGTATCSIGHHHVL